MLEKYFLNIDQDRPLGVRYDSRPNKGILSIGSYASNRVQMELVLSEYFKIDPYDETVVTCIWTQKNKLRYDVNIPRKQFVGGINLLKEHSMDLRETNLLGRVMC